MYSKFVGTQQICFHISSLELEQPKEKDSINSYSRAGESMFKAWPVSLIISSFVFGPKCLRPQHMLQTEDKNKNITKWV